MELLKVSGLGADSRALLLTESLDVVETLCLLVLRHSVFLIWGFSSGIDGHKIFDHLTQPGYFNERNRVKPRVGLDFSEPWFLDHCLWLADMTAEVIMKYSCLEFYGTAGVCLRWQQRGELKFDWGCFPGEACSKCMDRVQALRALFGTSSKCGQDVPKIVNEKQDAKAL